MKTLMPFTVDLKQTLFFSYTIMIEIDGGDGEYLKFGEIHTYVTGLDHMERKREAFQ